MLIAGLNGLAAPRQRPAARLGLLMAGIGATLIFFNYVLQTTFVPALLRTAQLEYDPLIAALTMVNPGSLAWALEMWGYGFLGLGGWLAAPALNAPALERAARGLMAGNGIISLIGTLITVIHLEWVLTTAGMLNSIGWNAYFLATLVVVAIALRRRAR